MNYIVFDFTIILCKVQHGILIHVIQNILDYLKIFVIFIDYILLIC